jgi:hypothetical protein
MEITDPYITLEYFKDLLGKSPADVSQDDTLSEILLNATRMVVGYTNRYFMDTLGTLVFDAPQGSYLPLPDLRSVVSFTFYGAANWPDSNYLELPYDGPPYTMLRRIDADGPISWREDQTGSDLARIVIDGLWGYTLDPSIDVQRATEILASKLWHNRMTRHTRQAVSTTIGGLTLPPELISTEIDALLGPLRRVIPEAL